MKDNLEDIMDISDEEFEEALEDFVVQLQSILEMAGVGHILDGKLTHVPAGENDTIH